MRLRLTRCLLERMAPWRQGGWVCELGTLLGVAQRCADSCKLVSNRDLEKPYFKGFLVGAAGSNRGVDGRFEVFATCLLQKSERLLQICYPEGWSGSYLALKFGFSMTPNVNPSGVCARATRIPSPTSCTGLITVAPFSSRCANPASASATPK